MTRFEFLMLLNVGLSLLNLSILMHGTGHALITWLIRN